MGNSTNKKATLSAVLQEIKTLRREVSLFMPSESLKDFSNKKEILSAYQKAREEA